MNPFPNLPPEQHELQRRVDRNNAEEALWRKLAPRRRLRHKLLRVLGKRALHELDLRELATARPPEDAIGQETANDNKPKSKRQMKPRNPANWKKLCSLDFRFKEANSRFKKLGL